MQLASRSSPRCLHVFVSRSSLGHVFKGSYICFVSKRDVVGAGRAKSCKYTSGAPHLWFPALFRWGVPCPIPPGTPPCRTRCSGATRAGQRGAHPAHAAGSAPSQGHAAPPPGWSRLRNWEALMDTALEELGWAERAWGGVGAAGITWGTWPVGHRGSLPQCSISPALVHGAAPKLGLPG